MKFVIKRDTVNPPWLEVTIDPKTPGFKHQNHFHKGCRFSIGQADTIAELSDSDRLKVERLNQGQCVVIDDGSPKSNAAIAQIDAEVKTEIEQLRRAEEKERAGITKPKTDWVRITAWLTLAALAATVLIFLLK
jgi:hypothetical protein